MSLIFLFSIKKSPISLYFLSNNFLYGFFGLWARQKTLQCKYFCIPLTALQVRGDAMQSALTLMNLRNVHVFYLDPVLL